MLLHSILAALVFGELLAEERKVEITFEKNSFWVNVSATWPVSSCGEAGTEYQVSTFFENELESIHFVKTPKIVLKNQPYWKVFTLEVKYLCGGQVQPDPIKTPVEIGPGDLGPVRHFSVDGTIATPIFRWKPNSLDAKSAREYEFVFDAEGKDTKQTVREPNITLKSRLPPDTVISVTAFATESRTEDSRSKEVSRAIYTNESEKHEATVKSLSAAQTPRTNTVRVSWAPVSYVRAPIYTVTWLKPDKSEYTENTTTPSIEMEVFGKHGSVQEISVHVRDPDKGGLQILGSEAVTTFVYKSLPAPNFNLLELGSNSAIFDLFVAEEGGALDFEVNGVGNRESKVVLKDLLHMKEYLIRARGCFVGGICGDEGYNSFTFVAPLDIRDLRLEVLSSSELRASWQPPEGRNETTFAGYGLTLSVIQKKGRTSVKTYEVNSTQTSYTFSYDGTDRLYTLEIAAYEEREEGKVPGHTSTLSIVVPKMYDEVAALAPMVKEIIPAIKAVTLDLEKITTRNVRLFLVDHSGRWNRTASLKTRDSTLRYNSLSDLTPYESYFGSLQACDDSDSTKCGIPNHFNFRTLTGAPSAPTGLEVTFVNKTCIEFRWEPPTDTGAPSLNHYELKLRKGEDIIASNNVSAETTDSVFDQLKSGTTYIIEVTAVNVNHLDEWFFSETAKITISTTSSAPLWILVVGISVGVVAGTGFFLVSTKRRIRAPSAAMLEPEAQL